MDLAVIGAGVGRTGTHSLKLALEQLLKSPCHHMFEIKRDATQIPPWTDAICGRSVNWQKLLAPYRAIVDWPGAAYWQELSEIFPNALVLLSVRKPEDWYRSASDTIFLSLKNITKNDTGWGGSIYKMLGDRFSDQLDNPTAMINAFIRHNDEVRSTIPEDRLLEWNIGDGWGPICERLTLPVPTNPFPLSNTSEDFRKMMQIPPVAD